MKVSTYYTFGFLSVRGRRSDSTSRRPRDRSQELASIQPIVARPGPHSEPSIGWEISLLVSLRVPGRVLRRRLENFMHVAAASASAVMRWPASSGILFWPSQSLARAGIHLSVRTLNGNPFSGPTSDTTDTPVVTSLCPAVSQSPTCTAFPDNPHHKSERDLIYRGPFGVPERWADERVRWS